MTLRARLGVALAFVVVVLLVAGVLLPRTVRASQIDQVDQQLRAAVPVAVGLGAGLRPDGALFTVPSNDTGGTGSATALSELYVARVKGKHRTVVLAPASTAGREPGLPPKSVSVANIVPVTVGSQHGSGSWRALLLSLPNGSRSLVALPLDGVDATFRRLTLAVLIAGGAVIVALGVAGWWLFRLGLRPIAEVTEVADAIVAGDRSRRVGPGVSGTEAAHLGRAFNVMLDDQQETEATLRRFVADASHELRTPVAAIGGFADLWRQGAIDPTETPEMMRRIGQESVRMRGLVEDLLLLARLDEGRPLARDRVDLTELAHDARLDASATHPSRLVAVEAPESVVVVGDEARLRQVLANLVGNALVHTDPATSIDIRVEQHHDLAVVTVSDDGPGMEPTNATKAFDRFWRADGARQRSGTGLGLSIVRGIVEEHGGQTHLESSPNRGTTVRFTLPLVGRGSPDSEETHNL